MTVPSTVPYKDMVVVVGDKGVSTFNTETGEPVPAFQVVATPAASKAYGQTKPITWNFSDRSDGKFELDGLGLGPDSTIWGGELLLGNYHGFERRSWLKPSVFQLKS